MGIIVEVNLHEEAGKYFIEIVTHLYSVPISFVVDIITVAEVLSRN